MPYHNIKASIDSSQQSDYLERIAQLKHDLDFLINLSPKERKSGGRLSHHNYGFVKSAIDYANYNNSLMPASFSLSEWQADVALYDALSPIAQQLNSLLEAIEDTRMALRMESQKAALDFLKFAKIAAQSNVPGTTEIVEDLSTKLDTRRGVKNKKKEYEG